MSPTKSKRKREARKRNKQRRRREASVDREGEREAKAEAKVDLREMLERRKRRRSTRERSSSSSRSKSPPTPKKKEPSPRKRKKESRKARREASREKQEKVSWDVDKRVEEGPSVDKDFRQSKPKTAKSPSRFASRHKRLRSPDERRASHRRSRSPAERRESRPRSRSPVLDARQYRGVDVEGDLKKRARSRSSESSLSLSSASGDEASPPRRSPTPPRPVSRPSSRQEWRESGWANYERAMAARRGRWSGEGDRRRRDWFRGGGREWRRHSTEDDASWEERVRAFVEKTSSIVSPTPPPGEEDAKKSPLSPVSPPPGPPPAIKRELPVKTESETESVPPPPPGLDRTGDLDSQEEDMASTPLVRYIGKKLSAKGIALRLEGVFEYNLLSLLTRAEWVAAKTVKLLEAAGYSESSLYLAATAHAGGGPALETELKSAVFTGKVELGSKPELVAQVLRVVEILIKYFTKKDDEESSGAEDAQEDGDAKGNAVRRGVGDLLKQLQGNEVKEEPSPTPKVEARNPWTNMWDRLQSDNLHSFSDMKVFISKDLLRLGDAGLCGGRPAFDVAQDMVCCLVVGGYSLHSLRQMVAQSPAEAVLPPKEHITVGHDGAERNRDKRFLFDVVLERLAKLREEQAPKMTAEQLEYLVRKALAYVMRGLDKSPAPAAKTPQGLNIVYNYLPPGLREMEQSNGQSQKTAVDEEEALVPEGKDGVLEDGITPKNVTSVSCDVLESTDPLNSILNPNEGPSSTSSLPSNPNELPARRYLTGYVHAEWLMLQGKPQIYEISVYFPADLSSTTVYMVPEAMQRQPAGVLDALGFVANPDRPEFYFVQVGVGVIKTLSLAKAVQKLSKFLEEKRHAASSENRNNGLVLNFYSEEELGVVLEAFEASGHKSVFVDTVRGLGFVEAFLERNRSKNLEYSGPRVSVAGADCFFHTEVRRGLAASELVSKTKAEALCKSLEFFLQAPPTYKTYLKEFCFPSLSPRADEIRRRHRACAELYHLEVFLAAELKLQLRDVYLEGPFAPPGPGNGQRDLRDRHSVLASRVCRALAVAGCDLAALRRAHAADPEFAVNSNLFLDRLGMSQRLKLMDQTMRCVRLVQSYFSSSKK